MTDDELKKYNQAQEKWNITFAEFERSHYDAKPIYLRFQCHFCKFMFDQDPPDDTGFVYSACAHCRADPELDVIVEPYNKGV